MFSRYRKDQEPENILDNFPAQITETDIFEDFSDEELIVEDPKQIVEIAEKFSTIFTPYFFVLVGLFLYKENTFLGGILLAIGAFSLLKISWQDIGSFLLGLKSFLGLSKSPDETID
jgi:hypothetical protein